RPLIESVAQMAVAAATRDPRFPAVRVEELPELQIEISALTPLYPLRPEQIQVGVHGLMIVKGKRKGLLLPHVPLAFGWDREDFLANLYLKAGLGMDAWRAGDVELLAFHTEVWEED
ncbi:MAG: AmmeMemoRadiSam system protein A, partial [Acidobacteria bacterium]|nr:AmmeMemoRadiSam system protein A [Acidobacteriota bacterium]